MITAGFDIGFKNIKTCIVQDSIIIGRDSRPLSGNFKDTLFSSYQAALLEANIAWFQIKKTAITGWATVRSPAKIRLTPEHAAAKACFYYNNEILSVVDAGALFVNTLTIDTSGNPVLIADNEKCAAGSGKFLEVTAKIIGVNVADISDLAFSSTRVSKMVSNCAVFAESEVIGKLNSGENPGDIIASIISSIALKTNTMLKRITASGPLMVCGGLAKNKYFINKLRTVTDMVLLEYPEDPMYAGAFGAALWALDSEKK
ncbi:hypothetical protein KKF34_00290 [Myxococcota bacterium]|nr:hypothetical protein [Myxococcota bacterium]MBU1380311.1 hypothetical protein [Myxococcota bacterium]MBU1495299.1 hypothetical protein [Myxococcota bacterium]